MLSHCISSISLTALPTSSKKESRFIALSSLIFSLQTVEVSTQLVFDFDGVQVQDMFGLLKLRR